MKNQAPIQNWKEYTNTENRVDKCTKGMIKVRENNFILTWKVLS